MKRKLAAAISLVFATVSQASSVFINEIHYDNTGADIAGFVEVAAPAGTNLTGWSIQLYNGNNGTEYDSETLLKTVLDQVNGYGFINVSPLNLQNGSPDGIALVDNNGIVVQFLSYEGFFTATNGSAEGLISEDIGVSENSSTPIGFSLQLSGIGKQYADFTWTDPSPASAGLVNPEQSFGNAILDLDPTVIITPADGDTNVAIDAKIDLQFSEEVVITARGPIVCTSEVFITSELSGAGTSYSLHPDQNFAPNDQCSFTLRTTDVVDTDGEANNLAEDVTVNFTVVNLNADLDFVINELHADPANNVSGVTNGDGIRDATDDDFVELVNTSPLVKDRS
jgi:hypothetical protein